MKEPIDTISVGDDKITKEELDYLVSGVRPPDMEFERYKKLRKEIKNGIKGYLKGKYFFISANLVPLNTDDHKKPSKYVRKTATYVKEK